MCIFELSGLSKKLWVIFIFWEWPLWIPTWLPFLICHWQDTANLLLWKGHQLYKEKCSVHLNFTKKSNFTKKRIPPSPACLGVTLPAQQLQYYSPALFYSSWACKAFVWHSVGVSLKNLSWNPLFLWQKGPSQVMSTHWQATVTQAGKALPCWLWLGARQWLTQ